MIHVPQLGRYLPKARHEINRCLTCSRTRQSTSCSNTLRNLYLYVFADRSSRLSAYLMSIQALIHTPRHTHTHIHILLEFHGIKTHLMHALIMQHAIVRYLSGLIRNMQVHNRSTHSTPQAHNTFRNPLPLPLSPSPVFIPPPIPHFHSVCAPVYTCQRGNQSHAASFLKPPPFPPDGGVWGKGGRGVAN